MSNDVVVFYMQIDIGKIEGFIIKGKRGRKRETKTGQKTIFEKKKKTKKTLLND